MKGVKKCFIFSVMLMVVSLVYCLAISSGDVHALKYSLEYLPYSYPLIPNNTGHELHDYLTITGTRDSESVFLKDFDGYYFNSSFNSNSSKCEFISVFPIRSSNGYSYAIPYYLQPPSDFSGSVPDFFQCYPGYTPFANGLFDSNSFPSLAMYRDRLIAYLPYRFYYNGAFLRSHNDSHGLDRYRKLDFADLYENRNLPDTFQDFTIPVGVSTVRFTSGEPVTFSGSFYFDSEYPDSDVFVLPETTTLTLRANFYTDYSSYIDLNGVNYGFDVPCSLNLSQNSNSTEAPWILSYNCSFNVPSGSPIYDLSGFHLKFNKNNGSYIFTLPHMSGFYFDTSDVITNNDRTPTSDSFQEYDIVSSQPLDDLDVPGYADGNVSTNGCSDGDWFCSLISLFDFNFFNPFNPLFTLFTDQSSCVSIPIISGMLGSQESSYCPWFNSTTRNILTPVLGFSSMMLVFGFAVRWLGASSGNMFEDQTTHRWGNTQIKQKGSK